MITNLPTDKIHRRIDARFLNQDTVSALAESISTVGLINPIRVRAIGDGWEISAGAHRHAAYKRLGLTEIACIVVSDDDLHAELSMIDENLCRSELSPAERSSQTARRKAIYLELHPGTANGGDRRSTSSQTLRSETEAERFTANTAAATGQSERIVQLYAERGEKVIPEALNLISGSKLDTGSYLDKIKKLSPNDQVTAVKRDLSLQRQKEQSPKIAPAPQNDSEVKERQVAALMSAWNKAGAEAREEFLQRIEIPVFDRSTAGAA